MGELKGRSLTEGRDDLMLKMQVTHGIKPFSTSAARTTGGVLEECITIQQI